jgi:hypothetical protein
MQSAKVFKFSSIVVTLLLATVFTAFANAVEPSTYNDPFLTGESSDDIEKTIARLGGPTMLKLANAHGITSIMGKNIPQHVGGSGSVVAQGADNPVGVDPVNENTPSIAAKPNNEAVVVAVSQNYAVTDPPDEFDECVAYRSTDGGETWSNKILLPLLEEDDFCQEPVVRWAPNDGADPDAETRVYVVYVSVRENLSTSDIVVSYSNNEGRNWIGPIVAIAGVPGDTFLHKPWIATHVNFPGPQNLGKVNDKVYVTATRENSDLSCQIVFVRSSNGAVSFGAPKNLANSADCIQRTVDGSRPAGGPTATLSNPQNYVLVCWYDSRNDGFTTGLFDIKCRTSTNFGNTFNGAFAAVSSRAYELPFFKCPDALFETWYYGMFPAIEISRNGVAHIVYAADPTDGADDGECGDIYYTKSPKGYSNWTPRVLQPKLNDDGPGKAQGFPTITSKGPPLAVDAILVAAWVDHRDSAGFGCTAHEPIDDIAVDVETNCIYDIYYTYTDASWKDHANRRVTDVSSFSDEFFAGEYIDSSAHRVATTPPNALIIWTDRSDKSRANDMEDDVYSDRVSLPP